MQVPTQLPLSVRLRADAQFDNFIAGPNAVLLDSLVQLSDAQSDETILYLYGASGCGRSHLLQACCHRVELRGLIAIYLPASELLELDPAVFESLEIYDLICIDDIDQLMGQPHWEEALFHLYNRIRDLSKRLVISANAAPKSVGAELPDLGSRLLWGLVFQLHELDESAKLDALSASAQARGLTVSDEVLQFMLNHGSRNLKVLMEQLDQLDQASLTAKRKLTIPFIKQVLGWS